MENGESLIDTLWYIWFVVLIALGIAAFIAKLKFNEVFKKREERRRMLSYSRVELAPNEDGLLRGIKVKKVDENAKA
ncbi:hypothetical protein AGMMS49938_18970 [Fibrobacterales bacterium]|nr:hypothetical protein AGMMS49938_18970 [Fibrobacterales bacterium]